MSNPFLLVTPATRGLSLAITRHLLATTSLPVYATHRSSTASNVKQHILSRMKNIDPARLIILPLDLASEPSIANAASMLAQSLPKDRQSYIDTGFFTGGMLCAERRTADLDVDIITKTFQINVIAHLLLIKHFSQFLPSSTSSSQTSKWVHISARVGSISDNKLGGWYSYRASKAALNQVIATFDRELEMQKKRAICVGMHPGTVKTELSKPFWKEGEKREVLFEPEEAAEKVVNVVKDLGVEDRGRLWDWKREVIPW